MLRVFGALAFVAAVICCLLLFTGEMDAGTMLYLGIGSALSGAILWGFADVKEDVREIRIALVPSQEDEDRSATEERECVHCHKKNPPGSKHCVRCGQPL